MSFSTIDLTNMMRGEGEWKNMQEIVRRTLKMCFDQMEKQGELVAHLTGQVAGLKNQLASKVSREEIESMMKAQHLGAISAANVSSKHYVSHTEHDKLKDQFAHLRNDLERKASVRYVDECLRRKVDRSDLLAKNLATFSAAQYSSQLTQMYQELTDTKTAVEALSRATSDMQRDVQGVQDLPVVRSQMDAIYRSMQDYYPKNHVKALLEQKQDVSGLDAMLTHKAENSALQATTHRIEEALERHEKAITGLRLKLNDTSLFEARETLARNSALPLFTSDLPACTARRCRKKRSSRSRSPRGRAGSSLNLGGYSSGSGYDSATSTGSCRCNNAEVGGKNIKRATSHNTSHNARSVLGGGTVPGPDRAQDLQSVLRDGRVQALLEGLWTKVDNSEVVSMRLRQELESLRAALSRCETTLSQVAGAAQVETLGLVVEEQRQRIDSIITGSTAIESITEEFVRQQGDISELQAFLQLPGQHKPLRAQLDEAGELMDVLSHRMAELGALVGHTSQRIETVEMNNKQLETRVQMSENGREKLLHMQHVTDLTGTDYASLKDIARRLTALSGALVGEAATTTSIAAVTSKAAAPLLNRVSALEVETKSAEESRRQLDARMRELKLIVRTVGFGGGNTAAAEDIRAPRSAAGSGSYTTYASEGEDRPRETYRSSSRDFERKAFSHSSTGDSPRDVPSLQSPALAVSPGRGRVNWSESNNAGRPRATASASPTGRGGRGNASPARLLRSPLLSPRSPAKSPLRVNTSLGANNLHRQPSTTGSSGRSRPMSPLSMVYNAAAAAAADLDNSRVSVDFEQILTSATSSGPSGEFVPLHELPMPPSRQSVRYGGGSSSGNTHLGGSRSSGLFGTTGTGAGSASSSHSGTTGTTIRGAKLESVDQRLHELKMEKERLQRRLLDHAVR